MAITFQGSNVNAAPGSNFNVVGNIPAGLIVVALAVGHSNSQGGLNCVINGVLATQLVAQGPLSVSSSFAGIAFFAAANPTANASGTIQCGWNNGVGGTVQRAAMAWWSLTGFDATPHDTAVPGAQTDPINLTIDVPAGGVVLAAVNDPHGTVATAVTWANATEQFDTSVESKRFSGAHQEYATTQTNLVVSADFTGATTSPQGVAVSFAPSGPPPATGTLAATEAADTAAMVGNVKSSGTLAATEAPDVAIFATVTTGYRQSVQVYVGGVAVGVREENKTAFAPVDQEFDITAARAWTPADFRDGTFAVYLGSHATDTPFEGHWDCTSVRITFFVPERTGTLAATESPDVALFVGGIPAITGTLAATEAADAAAFAGTVASRGTLAATEAADSAAIVGGIIATGTLAASEGPDVAAFTGGAIIGGTLAATEAADHAAFIGGGVGVNGILAAVEDADAAIFTATVATVGTLAASEAPDVAAFVGFVVALQGTLAAIEAPDAAAFTGGTANTGTLAATEAPDVALFLAKSTITGTLDATEAPDTVLAVGGVAWVATLAAVEAPDVAAITGTVRLAGVLVATEAPDAAAFFGGVVATGTLDATEEPDHAGFFESSIEGFFAALEAGDSAIIVGTTGDYGIDIIGDEDPHPIHGGCEGVPAIVGDEDPHAIKGAATPTTITGKARTPTIKGSV